MSTAGRDRTYFMTKFFHNLPLELQNLIMSKTYRVPKPKFHKGSIVKYSEKRQAELRRRLSQLRQGLDVHSYRNLGEQPFGRLIVWCAPSFDYKRNEWLYQYEYGPWGTSEGAALESDLVACSTQGGLTTMKY